MGKAMKKIGFVAPWYGKNIPGGAEMELRGLIYHLKAAGVELEVLTTCARDFMWNWNQNYYRQKTYKEDGIVVRRFRVTRGNHDIFNEINQKLINNIQVTEQEEELFVKNIINSEELCSYISKHREEYSIFVFIPYMFGTTYNGIRTCPEKAVVIPCLHDESYAYMKCYRECLSKSNGIIFNAKPESDLANRLMNLSRSNQAVLGLGVDISLAGKPERFRKKFSIQEPFLLYAGRKDRTKNVHTLLQYFELYKKRNKNNLQLVMIGPAGLPIPEGIREDVHDLGFVDVQDKYDAYFAATLLCQPSKNESFSIVVMESWLAGRPVLVHGECSVTQNFAREANGGFYFMNYAEFEMQVDYLLKHPETADHIGQQGRSYVMNNFSWDVIVERYMAFFRKCAGAAGGGQGKDEELL